MTCDRSVVFSGYSGLLHQWDSQPRYICNVYLKYRCMVTHVAPTMEYKTSSYKLMVFKIIPIWMTCYHLNKPECIILPIIQRPSWSWSYGIGFTNAYAINAYNHWCCGFESRSGWGEQHFVIKFASDLRQVSGFLRVLRFPPPIKLTATI